MRNNNTTTKCDISENIWYLLKWNYETHKYDYEVICGNYYFTAFEKDMNRLVNCPHCKKAIKVRDSYTSLEYHTNCGFGLCICEVCYKKEWDKRRKYRDD